MNAAIRAVVRTGIAKGLNVKGIMRGYAGLLKEEIIDMDSRSVSDIIQRGGTILYTARCAEFRTEEGQKLGAEICRKHGIDGIVLMEHVSWQIWESIQLVFREQLIRILLVQIIPSDLIPQSILQWKQLIR